MKKFMILLFFTLFAFNYLNAQIRHVVHAFNFSFNPDNITIAVGDTVEWIWDNGIHTTTSEATTGSDVWDAPLDASHTSFSIVITTEGDHPYHCTPHISVMTGTIHATAPNAVNDEENSPNKFQLSQNYPNPFNPSTRISWQLPIGNWQTLKVYDVLGNQIAILVDEYKPAGEYEVNFNAKGLVSGIYYYTLTAGNFTATRKMLLLK